MPTIIVQTTAPHGDSPIATLTERVITTNLAGEHYTAQLLERLRWAAHDAEQLESSNRALPITETPTEAAQPAA